MSGLFNVLRFIRNAFYWIPLGFPLSMFVWSYYAYVIIFCGSCLTDAVLQIVLIVVYHLLLVLCLWSYAMTTFTPPTPVPHRFKLGEVEKGHLASSTLNPEQRNALLEDMANRRGVRTRRFDGAVNYCVSCQVFKPDRCHHCSQCER
ncbi:hypothetical protein HPB48_018519 [Haemaphysalis longicornis]|uniref:Palmitoyltransferase n=1 Tax=Haemaphysalis longicornis TaxID=44386 RepID=A0A9J6GTP4_HAELO|nr:hypothetical protein HPB48_018519 [Haemaphysalis longicornis]